MFESDIVIIKTSLLLVRSGSSFLQTSVISHDIMYTFCRINSGIDWKASQLPSSCILDCRCYIILTRCRHKVVSIVTVFACICVAALSMQILKPAGFVETSHYPLLLLVYVRVDIFTQVDKEQQRVHSQRWFRRIDRETHCSVPSPAGY